ncbi:MAG TPA: geranylgeranylglycerol-phosphate geranylgeranyltransferase [Rhodothermales bacterium]|nr:geranylgeranylglycerol-phosphate geranylgeranyltransferase [Rhodothermales bacterium]HRR08975.1 geranylgeranylglycerol-phosphate geranylgeranyltransferase [Rhodothermales bacterium]
MKTKLKGMIMLCRPLNTFMFWISVWIGAWLEGGQTMLQASSGLSVLGAACSATAIGAGSNAINDYFDIEIDRINRPNRPLPSGVLSRQEAWWIWATLSFFGMGMAVIVSVMHLFIAVICVGLLYAYSRWFKKMPFWGNLMVAGIGSLGIGYGALIMGGVQRVAWALLFAFWATLARELVKDIQDMPGDQVVGARTLPIVWGELPTRILASFCIGITVLITPLPYLWAQYNGIYLMIIGLTNAVFIYAAYVLAQQEEQQTARTSSLLKGGTMLGMLALATQPF